MMKKKKYFLPSFSLIELLIVLSIITILTTVGTPVYTKTMERTRNHEAITNLRLIQAAERIYRAETGAYYNNPATIAEINDNLNLNLNQSQWGYSVVDDGTGNYMARAERSTAIGGYVRNYELPFDEDEPTCVGTCP